MPKSWPKAVAPAFLAIAATLFVAHPSCADLNLTYSDTGVFDNGTSTESFDLGGETFTLSFAPSATTQDPMKLTTPGVGALGTFTASVKASVSGGYSANRVVFGAQSLPLFTLNVDQTTPTTGTGTAYANPLGSYGYGPGFAGLTFSLPFFSDTFQIGSANYLLGTTSGGIFNPLTSNPLLLTVTNTSGPITVTLDALSAPEPSTLVMAFSGAVMLVAGGWWNRRRRLQIAV